MHIEVQILPENLFPDLCEYLLALDVAIELMEICQGTNACCDVVVSDCLFSSACHCVMMLQDTQSHLQAKYFVLDLSGIIGHSGRGIANFKL